MGGADHLVYTRQRHGLDGGDVVRVCQRLAQALRAVRLAVIVFWHIRGLARLGKGPAHVQEHGGGVVLVGVVGIVGIAQQGEIGKGLEGRAGLAQPVGGDVEIAVNGFVPIVQAAYHGQHFAGARANDGHGGVGYLVVHANVAIAQGVEIVGGLTIWAAGGAGGLVIVALEQGDMHAGGALGLLLQFQVNGGIDAQAAAIDFGGGEAV